MRRTTAFGLVLLVFFVGLAAGLLGARLAHQHEIGRRAWGHVAAAPPHLRALFLDSDYDFTPEQQERLDAIFRRGRRDFEQLHSDLRPEVKRLMESLHEEIAAVLTSEQLERFHRQAKRWRRGRRFDRQPPGRGPRRDRRPPESRTDPPSERDDG